MDQLPSAGTDPASLGDLSADASRVRQILDAINEPVVLVSLRSSARETNLTQKQ